MQFERYKKVLGTKEVGRSFDKFRDLKYNDKEKWDFIKLDYRRQHTLIENPSLALPNAKKATADDRKFTEYLFNSENPDGWAKGQAFTARLGYNKDNFTELKSAILQASERYPSIYKDTDKFGDKYEQKIVLYGKKDMPANVIIGWKVKDNKTWMTSSYIKEVDR